MKFRKINKDEISKLDNLIPKNTNWEEFRKQRIKQLNNNEIDIFVVEENNTFIGEITINYINHALQTETIPNQRIYLEAFRIDKKYQGQGLGQQLIEYCIKYYKDKGYTEFTIGVEDDNEIAKHIYLKLGFTEAIDKGNGNEFDPCEYTLYLMKLRNSIEEKISKLMLQCNLGQVTQSPIRVNGGLSHRMYKVVTDKGIYAVKELNNGIMKREGAYLNFVFSEKVTDIAKENDIPAIGAIKIDNNIMVKIEDTFFMIFDWLDGTVLKPNELHCEIIGKILVQIHNIDFSKLDNSKEIENLTIFNWQSYMERANERHKKYSKLLEENIILLEELNQKTVTAMKYANQNLIISHRDLDRKNVMWKDEIPYIIDWEASGYVNPIIEVISTAYYWCGGETEELDIRKFKKFLSNYKSFSKININDNVEILVYADFYSGLNWLEYNLKRSMCIDNNYDQSEIELAENEVIKSIHDIKYNVSQIDTIIELMKK